MHQSGYWIKKHPITHKILIELLDQKITSLDINSAKNDIINFIKNPNQIELWSKDFLKKIVRKIKLM